MWQLIFITHIVTHLHVLHVMISMSDSFDLGDTWMVVTSSPEAAEFVFRAEGKYPSRGSFEDNMMWVYDKLKLPPTMFFSYVNIGHCGNLMSYHSQHSVGYTPSQKFVLYGN